MSAPTWLAAFAFTTTFPVVSKSNHRHTTVPAASAAWRRFKSFESALALDARQSLPINWPSLAADLPLPRRPKVALCIIASTRIDAANLPKSVTDALEGVCYVNDASACLVSSLAIRSTTPAAVVAVAVFDADTAPEVMLADFPALQALAWNQFSTL